MTWTSTNEYGIPKLIREDNATQANESNNHVEPRAENKRNFDSSIQVDVDTGNPTKTSPENNDYFLDDILSPTYDTQEANITEVLGKSDKRRTTFNEGIREEVNGLFNKACSKKFLEKLS